jgi:cyclase
MARQVLNAGADKVSINTPALKNPDLINELSAVFGNQCVVIGIDTKNGEIYKNTGNPNKMSKDPWTIIEWIVEVQKRGAGEIVLNSMSQDGEKNGFDLELLRKVKPYLDVPVVASGGAGKVEHFEAIFRENLAEAGLAASIFHSGEVQIGNLKSYLRDEEICVR